MFIRQLKYLVALYEEKHFGRAASACNVSQPALSGAIRSIEQELGIAIVKRGRRFEGFTADGERVLLWARRVLADCDHLRQEAQAHGNDPTGVCRMGAIPAALPLVSQLTQACLHRYPRIRHEIHTLSATDTLHRITDFKIDLGLTYLDDDRLLGTYETFPLFRERYVIVAADETMFEGASAMTWSDAATLPLCLFTANMQCRRGIDAAFAASDAVAAPHVETDSMTALCSHVRHAGLYCILPHSALILNDASERLPAIPMSPEMYRDIGIVLLNQQPRSSLLDTVLATFRNLDLQRWVDALLSSSATSTARAEIP